MAEKELKAGHPPATNGYTRSDEEAQTAEAEKLRVKKRKRLTFFIIFMVSQIVIGIVIGLTIMKVKNPKFRVRSATFETFNVATSSFNMTMNAELGVKNPNFGPYKYRNTTVEFYYGVTLVGTAIVPKSKAGLLKTKKFNVAVNLIAPPSLQSDTKLASDISFGLLPLSSQSKLSGKVELMLIMKKKKSTQMSCIMNVNIKTQQLQDVMCN
ncbi:hypothetical protein CsSME_00029253 [Camellia sinensis var. sinensis]|uniref:Late embryogenesis abundant protein LEA-2 subgroup domain-containing protein n=1 Tax=Camellia sinensis var. sinensis TaxID=542762 RepID=A0A4S4DED4_CAMSN|nr:uncharacterized protein LOC114295894 [Camellia sinensis]THG01029.1 hypothetical protein TEA_027591 [Camellia sinensis var. sinensis]